MSKAIYFSINDQGENYCTANTYYAFIDYAFSKTNYFMLVYVDYYGKGYTENQKYFYNRLKAFEKKRRKNPSWPGTPKTFCPNTTYEVVFYENVPEAKEILKEVSGLSSWTRGYPEDLAFFMGKKCWFYSVGHECIGALLCANENDLDFIEKMGLIEKREAFVPQDDYFSLFDENDL